MDQAAKQFVGEHDFAAFCSAGAQVQSTVRTIYSATVEREQPEVIRIRIRGNGFLYNMVRIIAGTLLEVGRGNLEVSQIADIIASKDRANAGPTAPAKGLKLMQIEYL